MTQKILETKAQTRPDIVEKYHRFYPKVIYSMLLNKILIEAQLRKALT